MKEKLEKLSSKKLIDVVKNYIQYGYSEDLRNQTIEILEERGITKEMLSLQGNLHNVRYDDSKSTYNDFLKFSKISFITYLAIVFLNISNSTSLLTIALTFSCVIIFFIFIIKSFLAQEKFYKLIQKERSSIDSLLFFIIGMPFYLIIFFYYKNEMNSELKNIQ